MSGGFRAYDIVKRGLDIVVAAVALVLLAPVIVATAVLVAVRLGRPVLFAQPRPGRHGRIFTLYKFRSMRAVDPARGWVSDADRLTPFGVRLRATSLDELPSLWNVLRGDMSIVGPRPLLVEYLHRYAGAGTTTRGAAGDHRARAGHRAQCRDLGAALRSGRALRGSSQRRTGSAHRDRYDRSGGRPGGDLRGGACDDDEVR